MSVNMRVQLGYAGRDLLNGGFHMRQENGTLHCDTKKEIVSSTNYAKQSLT